MKSIEKWMKELDLMIPDPEKRAEWMKAHCGRLTDDVQNPCLPITREGRDILYAFKAARPKRTGQRRCTPWTVPEIIFPAEMRVYHRNEEGTITFSEESDYATWIKRRLDSCVTGYETWGGGAHGISLVSWPYITFQKKYTDLLAP